MVLQVLKRLVEMPGFWDGDEPERSQLRPWCGSGATNAPDPRRDRPLPPAVHALVVASQAFLNYPPVGSDQSRSDIPAVSGCGQSRR